MLRFAFSLTMSIIGPETRGYGILARRWTPLHFLSTLSKFVLVTVLCLAPALGQFVEQGPGPILFGQDEGIPDDPVSGAINWIVLDPANRNIAYLATVNGGVW